MPKALDLPDDVFKSEDGRWQRICPSCESEISHLRRNYAIHSSLLKQPCIGCSNKSNHPSGMVGPVRVAWFNSFMKSALSRGLTWDLEIRDVASLYEQQAGRCALSGLAVSWSSSGWEHTASIDRIDNSKGYSLDNIQIVHKEINMMRGSLEVGRFIELCQMVADRVKW